MSDIRKRRVIILLSLLTVLSMIFGLTACSLPFREGTKMAKNEIRIGISVYDQYDTFISGLMEYLLIYAKQKEEQTGVIFNIEVVNASASQTEQNDQVEDFINNGCDLICVNLVDRTDPSMIIDKAKSADIPVIFFNRELVAEDLLRWDKLYYVGAVALESGIMEGQLVVQAYQDNPAIDKNHDEILQYVMLEGEAGHQDAIVRTEYSVNTVSEAGIEVQKLSYAIANWNRGQALTKMSQWIDQYGTSIEVVFANNDDMALGAIDALMSKEVPKDEWPLLVGIDGTDVGLRAVREKNLYGTVYNDKEGQAKGIIELAYHLITKEALPEEIHLEDEKYIRLPHSMVTEKTVDQYLN